MEDVAIIGWLRGPDDKSCTPVHKGHHRYLERKSRQAVSQHPTNEFTQNRVQNRINVAQGRGVIGEPTPFLMVRAYPHQGLAGCDACPHLFAAGAAANEPQ